MRLWKQNRNFSPWTFLQGIFHALTPYFAAPLVVGTGGSSLPAPQTLEIYLLFLVCFSCWRFLRCELFGTDKSALPQKPNKIEKRPLRLWVFLFWSFFLVASLELLRRRVTQDVFLFVVGTIILGAVAQRVQLRSGGVLILCLRTLFRSCVAYLSFTLYLGSWSWQTILISIALATPLATSEIAARLEEWSNLLPDAQADKRSKRQRQKVAKVFGEKPVELYSRLYCFLFLSSPFLILVLFYLKFLPSLYILTLVIFLPGLKLMTSTRNLENSNKLPTRFAARSDNTVTVFLLILALLGFWYSS